MDKRNQELINLDKVIREKSPVLYKRLPQCCIAYLKRKIHQDELNDILIRYADRDGVDFMTAVVEYFGLHLRVEGLDKIDRQGRYVFASNHPLGGLDGICLSAVVGEWSDKKIKYIVNDLLLHIKNLRSIFVPVNKYGAQSRNATQLINEAFWSDNQIITFPAGLCSRKTGGKIRDLEWKRTFIQKAVETRRDIVPVFFEARNSNFFYTFANIRKHLGLKFNIELVLLPDEMFKNKNKTFTITFGNPIAWQTFDRTKTASEWANNVKETVYSLSKTQ
ncbi:MAG: 1-acyl-sn-glycerol-3-phosphate acyltransferase [Prevotella sp.]|jgi:putative hemolysin|nr:1-acyl-sn-glycerol-3-phosphate acyltransferase [Prevotella sp.]